MEKNDRICFYTKDGGGVEYNRKEEAFRLINRKFPILKEGGCIISEKSTKPVSLGFVTEVKKISGLPLIFDFFKNHVDDSYFNGEKIIYFNEDGSFSNEPSNFFISFLGNKKIKGDMVSIYNAMVNFPGKEEKIDLEEMKIEYIIFLLKKEPAMSSMFAFSEETEKENINYAYGEVSITSQGKLIAEVFNDCNDAVYKEEMDFCYLSYLFLSPNRIIGNRLVRKLEKILIENS